ncbi:hypothetical protein HX799_09350 [Pseudomonas tolaasii]|nr:hypothetical protein [Pseudomonas tolaasii]
MRSFDAHIQKQHGLVDRAIFALGGQVGDCALLAQAGDKQQGCARAGHQ